MTGVLVREMAERRARSLTGTSREGGVSGPDLDVAIVGDGPAGLALAAACREAGVAVTVIGRGEPWTATYGTWRDEVSHLPDDAFASITPRVVVVGDRRHVVRRPYGVLDGPRLRAHLGEGVEQVRAVATSVQHFAWGSRAVTDGGRVDARLVVDATGTGTLVRGGQRRRPRAWQTAYGVVLPDLAGVDGVEPDAVTLMDWRSPAGAPALPGGTPTFCYVVPVADGWLVEETVLAADPAVEPDALRCRLAARLGPAGGEIVAGAGRVERVRIPMGVALPSRRDQVVAFGAAAGYVHPVTGYSVAASLRAAPRVAHAIIDGRPAAEVHAAVWPASQQRARALHHYGLGALRRLDGAATRAFFDAFFDLPIERWAAYLRIDTSPAAVAAVMWSVFSAAPWPVRRRLLAGNPTALLRSMRG